MFLSAPASVTSTAPNPTVQVVWGVTNQGTAAASGSWFDTVWFSTNGVLDANSINLGNFGVSQTVPAGGGYWQTNSVRLPLSASGPYTLFVQVDAGNNDLRGASGGRAFRRFAGTFTLTPPDLAPISVTAPATVTASNPAPAIQVAWAVINRGIGAATAVGMTASGSRPTESWTRVQRIFGDFYFDQTVPARGMLLATNKVTLPASLGGTYAYTLFVQVNVNDSLYESDETNNVSAPVPGTLILDLPPQIVTQPVSRPQVVTAGGTVTFTVVASGTPPLHYHWQLNNAMLNGAANATLTFNNAQSRPMTEPMKSSSPTPTAL